MVTIDTDCAHCGATFTQPDDPGRKRRFCSGACRTAAYRARKRRQQQQERQQQDQTRRQHERERRNRQERERQRQDRQANDDAWWNARERYQHRQPPPHAGTSRPGTWCGPCGGVRGPHTYHHDDTAHQRARRRYEGLRAKAAGTSFPNEADACRAKADAMRDKYGL
jgi:hypothetical protein